MKMRTHPKIERFGDCPNLSHMSTTSNYAGIKTRSSSRDIQFSKNNMEEHVVAVHEDEKPSEN